MKREGWRVRERNTHQSHEFRVSAAAEHRRRGVGGLFYEDYQIQDQGDWFYLAALPYFNPIGPPTGYYLLNGKVLSGMQVYRTSAVFVPGPVTSNNPNVRPPGDAFFNDTTHGYQKKAAVASVDLDLVPRVLTLTAGTRYFRSNSSEVGSNGFSSGCSRLNPIAPPDPCLNNHSTDLDAGSEAPLFRLPKPDQPQLEGERRSDAVGHLVIGISGGWLQSRLPIVGGELAVPRWTLSPIPRSAGAQLGQVDGCNGMGRCIRRTGRTLKSSRLAPSLEDPVRR